MEEILKIGLPVYFIVYFGIAFILKSVIIARRIGKSPLVIPRDDSTYGLIGLYFKITLLGLFIYILVYSFLPSVYDFFGPIKTVDSLHFKLVGIALLLSSLIWTIVAQNQMKDSWRIGIDTVTNTELVTTGLFKISRNPVYLGMIISLIGLFLVTPNILTIIFLVWGTALIQIHIRLEEEYLVQQHGKKFTEYMLQTRRMI